MISCNAKLAGLGKFLFSENCLYGIVIDYRDYVYGIGNG